VFRPAVSLAGKKWRRGRDKREGRRLERKRRGKNEF